MKLGTLALATLLASLTSLANAADPPKQMTEAEKKAAALAIQVKVYDMLMGNAPAVDACTAAYTAEYPNGAGTAKLTVNVIKDGSVASASVDTQLDGARNLRSCLESVGRKMKFPPLNRDTEQMSLTLQVKKGAKFFLKKPGEQDKPGQQQQQQPQGGDEGFLNFLPDSFLPAYGGADSK